MSHSTETAFLVAGAAGVAAMGAWAIGSQYSQARGAMFRGASTVSARKAASQEPSGDDDGPGDVFEDVVSKTASPAATKKTPVEISKSERDVKGEMHETTYGKSRGYQVLVAGCRPMEAPKRGGKLSVEFNVD